VIAFSLIDHVLNENNLFVRLGKMTDIDIIYVVVVFVPVSSHDLISTSYAAVFVVFSE